MKLKKSIGKKKGGNNDFIDFLLQDKAEFLGFYFMINGITNYENINFSELNIYLEHINIYYNHIIRELTEKSDIYGNKTYFDNLDNFYDKIHYFSYYLCTLNQQYFKINKNNYGSEGHIIIELTKNKDEQNYFNSLSIYVKNFTDYSQGSPQYDLINYIQKIGCDIAVYQFIFGIIDNTIDFIEKFKEYLRKFYENFDINIFINECANTMKNINLSYSNENEKLQKYYNIYNYYNINHSNINFENSRILKCNFEPTLNLSDANYDIKILINNRIQQLLQNPNYILHQDYEYLGNSYKLIREKLLSYQKKPSSLKKYTTVKRDMKYKPVRILNEHKPVSTVKKNDIIQIKSSTGFYPASSTIGF